jgi:DNA-binding NarL/FixJ family response regulator
MILMNEENATDMSTALATSPHGADQLIKQETCVLIVENHPVYAQGLVDILQDAYKPVLAASAAQMRAALQRERVDIVLLDLDLGDGSNGLHLLTELIAENLRVIVCTGTASFAQRCTCVRLGARACLSKDEDGDVILRAIAKVCAGEDAFEPKSLPSLDNPDDQIPPLSVREISVLHRMMEHRGITNVELADAEHVCAGRIKGIVSSLLGSVNMTARRDRFPAEMERRGYYPGIQLTPRPRKTRSDKRK